MRLAIVVPVFNDWESFSHLLRHLDLAFASRDEVVTVYAVNDGSTTEQGDLSQLARSAANLAGLEVIDLSLNVGHQRAIALGLCEVVRTDAEAALVMDSDGEDPPEHVPTLLAHLQQKPDTIVVARRARRKESLLFRISYVAYRLLFVTFVGKTIRFGNFSLMPIAFARRMVLMPELWSNLATAFLRSRLPIVQVPLDRGRRYAGRSKMNFTSLISHGFSAISAYAETIFVRLLLASLVLFGLTILAVFTTVGLRLFAPAHATPGWATTVSFGMVIVLLQVVFVTLTSMLTLFNNRVQAPVIPARDYAIFIAGRSFYPTSRKNE